MGLGLASNLPGKISRRLAPSILSQLSKQAKLGLIAVSGTNGKSTSSGLLASILHEAGFKLVHNRQGANLVTGITACLVDSSDWQGHLSADYFVFEIDEAALPVVAKEAAISHILVTNLFRDQLDRFGELDTTAKLISRGIMENRSKAILNADDPNVAQMVPDTNRLFFGVEEISESALSGQSEEGQGSYCELSYCAGCGEEFSYEKKFYGQLGHYKCLSCGNSRPLPDVRATIKRISSGSSQFNIKAGEHDIDVELKLPGFFNIYNALGAAALALSLNIEPEAIRRGLSSYTTLFGRSEKVKLDGKEILIQLIKNPAGASQAVKAAASDKQGKFLIAINDNYADGRDVSWLWDADFEAFADPEIKGPFIVSGHRAYDMALRLKYAGVEESDILVEPSLDHALTQALSLVGSGELIWLLPTYTCLLELQKIMKARGCPLSAT